MGATVNQHSFLKSFSFILSVRHPEILLYLQSFGYGLMPVYVQSQDRFILFDSSLFYITLTIIFPA